MANRKSRKQSANRHRTSRPRVGTQMPFSRIARLPVDPPSFKEIPPCVRTIQLLFDQQHSTVHPAEFFQARFATDHYKCFILRRVRIWSSASASASAKLEIVPGSTTAGQVTALQFDDLAPVGRSAKVGYHPHPPFTGPWSGTWTLLTIASDQFPVLVEIQALFC